MKYSQLFGKTVKEVATEESSANAKLLTRGGFIRRELAGVYNYLPLGLRVLNKISNIVREEMTKAGAQELLLSAIENKESWIQTNRWDSFDALFQLKSRYNHEYALGPTHEEVIVPLVKQFIQSYKDLPLAVFQIQTKFRDEARAKSGILRGREFLMKDLYSFHESEKDFEKYYGQMKKVYKNIFKKVGLDAIETEASGGAFSKFSHEYQVVTLSGEDEIIYCPGGDFSQNMEIIENPEKLDGKQCVLGHGPLQKVRAIEVGNIFSLKTKFSEAFGLTFKDARGDDKPVTMGCYGIGISRLMGTIAEIHNDAKGLVWPENVAPFKVELIVLGKDIEKAEDVYDRLQQAGIEVLYDDRDASAGQKFADADLLGIPYRLVISEKTGDKIEVKKRKEKETNLITFDEVLSML